MEIRAQLHEGVVRNDPSYREIAKTVQGGETALERSIHGIKVYQDESGHLYVRLGGDNFCEPPSCVRDFVELYTLCMTFEGPRRSCGRYETSSSNYAILTRDGNKYRLVIVANSMPNLRTLHDCVRGGKMLPTISYEDSAVRDAEMTKLMNEVNALRMASIRDMAEKCDEIKKLEQLSMILVARLEAYERFHVALTRFAETLRSKRFVPFVMAKWVADELENAARLNLLG